MYTYTHTFFCLKLPATLWFPWGTDGDPTWMFKCSKSLFASFSHSYITVTFFPHSVFYSEVLYEHGRPWILWCSGSVILCLMPCAVNVLLCQGCQTNLNSCCSVSISFSLGIRENNAKDKAWLAISWAGILTAALNIMFRSWI